MALVYDDKDKVSYCAIPKVASSTWCWHFIKLGKEMKVIHPTIYFNGLIPLTPHNFFMGGVDMSYMDALIYRQFDPSPLLGLIH